MKMYEDPIKVVTFILKITEDQKKYLILLEFSNDNDGRKKNSLRLKIRNISENLPFIR